LIAGCNPHYACFLQLLKESAFRPSEASSLTPQDIDLSRGVVTLNAPLKWSYSRQFKMSQKLMSMITPLIHKTSESDRIWYRNYQLMSCTFSRTKKNLAKKLGNPNLAKITFKTFRHWKATMTYHKTKDILFVQRLLGHKSLKNTLVYTHLVDFGEEDSFSVRIASNLEEFTQLLESGFEYITDYGEAKVLRKRK